MKKVSKVLTAFALVPAIGIIASFPSQASTDPYIESALIEVCKAAMRNNVHQFKQTTAAYRLDDKTVALKVMCNGNDIIKFADLHHANQTSAYLAGKIGKVDITDLAKLEKHQVTVTD